MRDNIRLGAIGVSPTATTRCLRVQTLIASWSRSSVIAIPPPGCYEPPSSGWLRIRLPAIVRDSANLRPLRRLRGGGTPAALSPDGRFVALGAADGSVRLLDLRTGILRVASDRHDGAVTDLRFAPDSRTLLSAGSDGRLIRWNVADARQIETLAGHAGAVSRVTIAPDGRTAYSAGEDGTVISWDLSGNRRLDRPFSVPPRGPMVLLAEERGNDPADLAPEGQSLPYAGLRVAVSPGGGSFAVPDRAGVRRRARQSHASASPSDPGESRESGFRRRAFARRADTGGHYRRRSPALRRPARPARAAPSGLRHRPD